jgi:hypothetical protein
MLIERRLADFHAQKTIAWGCRRCGKRDFQRVLQWPVSAAAREGWRIAEIEGHERLFRNQRHVREKPHENLTNLAILGGVHSNAPAWCNARGPAGQTARSRRAGDQSLCRLKHSRRVYYRFLILPQRAGAHPGAH